MFARFKDRKAERLDDDDTRFGELLSRKQTQLRDDEVYGELAKKAHNDDMNFYFEDTSVDGYSENVTHV
jgi:hypothetical protein